MADTPGLISVTFGTHLSVRALANIVPWFKGHDEASVRLSCSSQTHRDSNPHQGLQSSTRSVYPHTGEQMQYCSSICSMSSD